MISCMKNMFYLFWKQSLWMQQLPDQDISNLGVYISTIKQKKKNKWNCIVVKDKCAF